MLKTLHTFYGAVGNPPTVDGALAAMAKALVAKATVEEISTALDACMFEKFPVRLPHILARIPSLDVDQNGEMRAAWDVLVAHVGKWARWNDDYSGAHFEKGSPALSERILDVVRRTGGLAVYLGMTFADRPDGKASFPFVQARFFDEYKAWSKVESIDRRRLIAVADIAKLTEQKSLPAAIAAPKPAAPKVARSVGAEAQIQRILKKITGPRRT